ncbi:MAG: site-specific DNA-methyltransferase [Flavobacteriaceae bacterium]|nr:site-specific DNA-methyltransferase [Flavobacteriaceae bacterium]
MLKYNTANTEEVQAELEQTTKQLESLGAEVSTNKKVKELQEKLKNASNITDLEQDVFSHLANFFKRYYKEGDFISMRRYKKDVYAIPYEGEEVKLHWANHDQYYIKTSENLKNYSFKVDGKTIKFELKEASTEQNNNKTTNDQQRYFAIYEEEPITVLNDDVLQINFTYEPYKKNAKQQDIFIKEAFEVIKDQTPKDFANIFALKPTESNKTRTLIEKHLNDFVSRNSFDYFIHKDLGGFLSRELDFYIKNEVLFIDDLNTQNEIAFNAQLSKIKAIKDIAQTLIDFLAQIENFQKKLWLKKKFVYNANYCITLDRIPEEYYEEILQNQAQLAEWKTLFNAEPKTIADLQNDKFLVLDTKFFDTEFKYKLLGEFDNIDQQTDGVLINSENFQALNLLQERYKEQIQTIYIDPPYNTGNDGFLYKDSMQHSSWMSFMYDRLNLSKNIMNNDSAFFTSIDDREINNLSYILNNIFGEENFISILKWNKTSTPPSLSKKIRHKYEFVLNYEKNKDSIKYNGGITAGGDMPLLNDGNSIEKVLFPKERVHFNFNGVFKKGRYDRVELLNDIEIKNNKSQSDILLKAPFKWTQETVESEVLENTSFVIKTDKFAIRYIREGERIKTPSDIINKKDSEVGTNEDGKKELDFLFKNIEFSYPKPSTLPKFLIKFKSTFNEINLDYFAGSGTTGHAVIKLNREDNGNRKYILVEMGTYFDTVTKPRIQKVIYTDNWKNGKPQDKKGISQMFKYFSLESYEDTLNNLCLEKQGNIPLSFADEYLLNYALNVESVQQLCNIGAFKNPFDYQLKITENNELIPTKIDLVESFNYLIGLKVTKIDHSKEFLFVIGETLKGEKVLVIWRNLQETTNEDLEKKLNQRDYNIADGEFDLVYVNGDHNLGNLQTDESSWKVQLIEQEFFNKMEN